jgi:hypothetical protein
MGNTTAGRTDAVRPYRKHPHISRVRLLPGSPFHESQLNMLRFLARQDTDSLLYSFRKAAGLPTGGAEPMTGWDAEDCKLRGHTTGHYLSAVSLAYAVSGDETYKRKAEAIVTGLAKCQRAMEASGKVHKGFLSAYDEEQFDLLLDTLQAYRGASLIVGTSLHSDIDEVVGIEVGEILDGLHSLHLSADGTGLEILHLTEFHAHGAEILVKHLLDDGIALRGEQFVEGAV